MENVTKHRDIKLVTTDRKRSHLKTEPNYYTMKWFLKNLLAKEINKTEVKMNKIIFLGLSVLDISKKATYDYWHDYVKLKYGDKPKLCYTDADRCRQFNTLCKIGRYL